MLTTALYYTLPASCSLVARIEVCQSGESSIQGGILHLKWNCHRADAAQSTLKVYLEHRNIWKPGQRREA